MNDQAWIPLYMRHIVSIIVNTMSVKGDASSEIIIQDQARKFLRSEVLSRISWLEVEKRT